jgi:hypothetical protein
LQLFGQQRPLVFHKLISAPINVPFSAGVEVFHRQEHRSERQGMGNEIPLHADVCLFVCNAVTMVVHAGTEALC